MSLGVAPGNATQPGSGIWRHANWLGAGSLVAGVAVMATGLIAVGWHTLSNAGQLRHTLLTSEYRSDGPALFAIVAVIFAAERLWPAVPRPATSRAHLVDAAYLLLAVAIAPLVSLLNTGFLLEVSQHASFLILSHIPLIPQIIIVAVILLGMDAMNWVSHVANHHYETLWRLHALHHSQEDMSVFTTFRTHPLAHASYVIAVLPALILEASGSLPGAAVVAYACLVTLPHANLRWTYGPFASVVVSPAFHRLHHASTPIDGKRAVNFGFVLAIWDRMAHTAVLPRSGEVIPTGISGRPVPIEQNSSSGRVLGTIGAQLLQPFIWDSQRAKQKERSST